MQDNLHQSKSEDEDGKRFIIKDIHIQFMYFHYKKHSFLITYTMSISLTTYPCWDLN